MNMFIAKIDCTIGDKAMKLSAEFRLGVMHFQQGFTLLFPNSVDNTVQ